MQSLNQVEQLIQSAHQLYNNAKKKMNPQKVYQALFDLEQADRLLQTSDYNEEQSDNKIITLKQQIQQIRQSVNHLGETIRHS
jgi:uncharacterized protein (UPF0332 family)